MNSRLKTPRRYKRSNYNPRSVRFWRMVRRFILLVLIGLGVNALYQNRTSVDVLVEEVGSQLEQQRNEVIPPTSVPVIDVTRPLTNAERAYRIGDYEAAITNYREVIRGRPNDLVAHFRLAYSLIITSDLGADLAKLEEALAVSELGINAQPEAPDGWATKGMALVWMDRNGEAISYAARALEVDPDYVMAQAVIAQAYWQSNFPDRAILEIEQAVTTLRELGSASEETIAQVFRTEGYIMERDLQRERAVAAYQRALVAAPNYTFLTAELSLTYLGLQQTREALDLINSALEEQSRDTLLLFYAGLIYTNLNDTESATLAFEQCINVDRENVRCLEWLGGTVYYSGAWSDAIPLLQRAADNGSTDPEAMWQLGAAYYWLNQCNVAIPLLRTAYQIAVDAESEKFMLRSEETLSDCGATLNP